MITQSELKEILHYDPDTGIFTWLNNVPRTRIPKGAVAGHIRKKDGYVEIRILGKDYSGHWLAWFYMMGIWPKDEIDHRNLKRSDNRFENLRDCSHSLNMENQQNAKCCNKVGLLGVSPDRNKFRAQIKVKGVSINLGLFENPIDAHINYLEAKRKVHAGCMI